MEDCEFVLVMVGDVMLGRLVNDAFKSFPEQKKNVWGDTLELLVGKEGGEGSQIVIGNLECVVTDNEEKYPKTFNYKMSPVNMEALKLAQFKYLSLANNHILDYCEAGLVEAVQVLKQHDIRFSGAGANLNEAQKPAMVPIGTSGLNMACFSFSDHYDYWAATTEKMGINYIDPDKFDIEEIKGQFSKARSKEGADLIGVFIHWGPNWRWQPSRGIVNLGHAFVDHGADFVFGHSSHHVQGIEIYKGHPIIYGAGGFVDDYAVDEAFRNDLSFIYRLGFKDNRPHMVHLTPTCIRHNWLSRGSSPPYLSNVQLAKGSDYKWLQNRMRELCLQFGTLLESDTKEGGMSVSCQMTDEVENLQGENK